MKLDQRLEAHIDGLRVEADQAWEICKKTLASDYAEDMFAAAVLAFDSNDETRIQDVMTAVDQNQNKAGVLISALGWLTFKQAEPHIEQLLADESDVHRSIGIAASAIHRQDPGHHLDKTVYDASPLLMAYGLRAYGELGRSINLSPYSLHDSFSDNDPEIRFSAAWSAARAGNLGAVETLKNMVAPGSLYTDKALNMAMRCMKPAHAHDWQKNLAASPDTLRLAVIGAGVIGDPALVPWLIEQMTTPALARVAGEAFTMITGIDIEREELQGSQPDGFSAGPNDDPLDHTVALDADDNLPWPNGELIAAWWSKNKDTYPSGARHLLGKPLSVNHLQQVLKTGLQRQRAAAALELAIMQPGKPLFNVQAPGFRQRAEINNA